MLQEPPMQPALCTADAFDALPIDKVGSRAAGKAVRLAQSRRLIAEVQGHPKGCEPMDEPLTGLPIGLTAASRC